MNDLTEAFQTNLKPALSIVVYKSDNAGVNEYYLESHHVNENGQLLEGKPLMQETLAEIVELFYEEKKERSQISGFISEQVLFYMPLTGGNYRLVWYHPAETRYMHFAKVLKIPSGKASVPALVYLVERNELSVFALKSDDRPTEKTKIYRAPFHNINNPGEVCLGNAKVKKPTDKTFTNVIKYWEDMFWLSEFAHLNGSLNPTTSSLAKLWTRLVKSKGRLKWSSLPNELKETQRKTLINILK